jgi:hypothetical protein
VILSQLVLTADSMSKLEPDERAFLLLAGQFSNDLTVLHKLVACSFREPADELEHKANAVFVAVLLKTLASKLWQGWELIINVYDGRRIGRANWLRKDTQLQAALKIVRSSFKSDRLLKAIRDQFGYHYDPDSISHHLGTVLAENGFEMMYSEHAVNAYYLSSELTSWSGILRTADGERFEQKMGTLVEGIAARSSAFLNLLKHIGRAFSQHVVADLGGTLEEKSTTEVLSIDPRDAILPVFLSAEDENEG